MANFRLFLFIILCSPTVLFSQEYDIEIEEVDVPFAVIEKAPVYPECVGENNSKLKKCTSDNIFSFVKNSLNKKKLLENREPSRYIAYSEFTINKEGKVENIKMRASDKMIENEVIRVLKEIPTLSPGEQKGKNIGTKYSIVIKFKIDENRIFSFI